MSRLRAPCTSTHPNITSVTQKSYRCLWKLIKISLGPLESKVRKDYMQRKYHKGDKNNHKRGNDNDMNRLRTLQTTNFSMLSLFCWAPQRKQGLRHFAIHLCIKRGEMAAHFVLVTMIKKLPSNMLATYKNLKCKFVCEHRVSGWQTKMVYSQTEIYMTYIQYKDIRYSYTKLRKR